MLRFSEYRNRLVNEAAPTAAGGDAVGKPSEDALRAEFIQSFSSLVDEFIAELKRQLINPMTNPSARRGVWDRIKGWWSNLWHGRYNQNNPYFWKNKLGDDLAATENVSHITLYEYRILQEEAALLEEEMAKFTPPAGAENLALLRIVDRWGDRFKQRVMDLVNQKLPKVEPAAPVQPAATSEPEAQGEEEPERKAPIPVDDEGQPPQASPTAPVDGDEEQSAPKTPTAPARDENDVTPPNTPDNVDWKNLPPHLQDEWNRVGGGKAPDRVRGETRNSGIGELPWILRLGDPRIKVLKSIPRQQIYRRLEQQGRIEKISNPISNKTELDQRIVQAQEKYEQMKRTRPPREPSQEELLQQQLQGDGGSEGPPTEAPASEAPPASPPENPPTEENPPRTRRRSRRQPSRTAPMPLPPPPASEDDEGAESENLPQKAARLMSELEPLNGLIGDNLYNLIAKRIQSEKPENLAWAEKELKQVKDDMENPAFGDAPEFNDDDLDFNSYLPLSARTRRYVEMLKNQTNESYRPTVNRRKLRAMPWDEKVKYLKELVRQKA